MECPPGRMLADLLHNSPSVTREKGDDVFTPGPVCGYSGMSHPAASNGVVHPGKIDITAAHEGMEAVLAGMFTSIFSAVLPAR